MTNLTENLGSTILNVILPSVINKLYQCKSTSVPEEGRHSDSAAQSISSQTNSSVLVSQSSEQTNRMNPDPNQMYHEVVAIVVRQLISESSHTKTSQEPKSTLLLSSMSLSLLKNLSPVSPEELGNAYEYLRGFKLTLSENGQATVEPSQSGKRNQGLFYTPKTIVSHIVSRTLDALELVDPLEYLDLRIVDPAVGTGVFLVEAMRQCTERILHPSLMPIKGGGPDSAETTREAIAAEPGRQPSQMNGQELDSTTRRLCLFGSMGGRVARRDRQSLGIPSRVMERLGLIIEDLQRRAELGGLEPEVDESLAVRIHLAEKCLYGADLDPTALEIARFSLIREIFGDRPNLPDIALQLRLGNSLIGSVRREEHIPVNENLFAGKVPLRPTQRKPNSDKIPSYSRLETEPLHWWRGFPEVFDKNAGGFHAVIGNPPFEILSVKESGIKDRVNEQAHLRRAFRTCLGKINTYRLMLERGLDLLRQAGVLGFIVPATLLSDSTAHILRKLILDTCHIVEAVVIPEKVTVFSKVTQALLILVCRKGEQTRAVAPVIWEGHGPIPSTGGIEIPKAVIKDCGGRIPILASQEEKALLEALLRHPTLGGNASFRELGRVHQGEINLTVHRKFIRTFPTAYPLIRGEHVAPFQVVHPSSRSNRLDWISPTFLDQMRDHAISTQDCLGKSSVGQTIPVPNRSDRMKHSCSLRNLANTQLRKGVRGDSESEAKNNGGTHSRRGAPWEDSRIVLARVVNMATKLRLKAAVVPRGCFLGDMTNFVADVVVPQHYLAGLLNSRLLNWRIKITSTNNYLSAAEIEALPIPRVDYHSLSVQDLRLLQTDFERILEMPENSVHSCLEMLNAVPGHAIESKQSAITAMMLEWLAQALSNGSSSDIGGQTENQHFVTLLNVLALRLYGVESFDAAKNFSV